ncbi:hypothetical protein MIND_00388900 [Mycena indigotica]|uniref:DUF6533 domain-containing protein n=1 Tax=Mycena indigotica TaxID=2126181 RepID=A0A8H6T3F8_9AGAR|nr:uncharacterized protein MIND_00388900 [Mycena indigotica]KAF7310155.1 hypothetical protein MIND_00388900 [Mycena indigotica]
MTTPSARELEALTTFMADAFLNRILFMIAFVILIYDHFLTLPTEVRFIWSNPMRPSARWFILNRYLALVTNMGMAFFTFLPIPASECAGLLLAKKIFLMAQQLVVHSILVLRVYAMFGLNRRLLFGLLALGSIVVGVGGWLTVSHGPHPKPPTMLPPPTDIDLLESIVLDARPNRSKGIVPQGFHQCAEPIFRASAVRIAAAWEIMLSLEVVIFALTVYRAISFRRIRVGGREQLRAPLLTRLVHDGVLYFLAIAVVNVPNLFLYHFGDPFIAASMSWVSSNLAAMLVARLMLNVHKAVGPEYYVDEEGPGHVLSQNPTGSHALWTSDLESRGSIVFVHHRRAPTASSVLKDSDSVSGSERAWPPEVERYMHQVRVERRAGPGAAEAWDDRLTPPPERLRLRQPER